MRRMFLLAVVLATSGTLWQAARATAQQVQLTAPFQSINDRFYSNLGMGWGLSHGRPDGHGFTYQGIPATAAVPPFGGWDPNADARFGFSLGGGNTRFNFGMFAGQGSTRTNIVQAPTVTIPNGGTGYFFDGSVRPFVTGFVPVVGEFNNLPTGLPTGPAPSISPLQQRLERLRQEPTAAPARDAEAKRPPRADGQPAPDASLVRAGGPGERSAGASGGGRAAADSTANRGDISVAEIRRQQAAEDAAREAELQLCLEKAKGSEATGKLGVAKIYYQQAASRATGELKQQLLQKIQSLGSTSGR